MRNILFQKKRGAFYEYFTWRRFKSVTFELRQFGALPGLAIKFVIFYEVLHVMRFPFIRQTDVSARNVFFLIQLKKETSPDNSDRTSSSPNFNINTVKLSVILLL
jgi:hypothetical protein